MSKNLVYVWTLLTALSSGVPATAWAHTNLVLPVPRNGVANKGPNGGVSTPTAVNGSCGIDPSTGLAVTRSASQTVTTLTAGSVYNVQWVETIAHTGYFQIWFSPNADDSNMVLLADNIPHAPGLNAPTNYNLNVTLPSVPCDQCVIRTIQVMLDNHPSAPTYYYSCANVKIVAAGAVPGPTSTPTPISNPTGVPCVSPVSPAPVSTSTPSPSPSPSFSPFPATFTSLKNNVLTPYCVRCHSGAAPAGGVNYSTYAGVLADVNTASPAQSVLYTATSDGAMPQGGPPLGAALEQLILQWIQGGAPNN